WLNADHDPRHAVRTAAVARIIALPAAILVRKTCVEHRLIFRRERRLLAGAARLARIPVAASYSRPLPFPVGILRVVECGGAGDHEKKRRDDTDRCAIGHAFPPVKRARACYTSCDFC